VIIDELRARRPRVHCITNTVAQTFTANMLLAVGAVPSMTIAADEVADFVAASGALLVNLGTLDPQRRAAIAGAVEKAVYKGVPWLLDPVFVERSPQRGAYARELVRKAPSGVRLNGAEFESLAGAGADTENLARYAQRSHTVVALTGEVDVVADGARLARIANGHQLMGRVTAMGCAGSAVVAACLAVESDAFVAIASGLVAVGVAGELAARRAKGPGTFAAAILDAIYALDGETLRMRAKVE
jgi:hydroxyethylthiazole kinase